MTDHISLGCLLVLPWIITGQIPYPHPGQYGPSVNNDIYQQQPMYSQQQQQQQQQYYQGNMGGTGIQSGQSPGNEPGPVSNQFHRPSNDQIPSSPSISTERYFVGNLSQTFSFEVAPRPIKITYLGLNGYSLFIIGMGFSDKSKFNYDEQNSRLTILSLDRTTVGYYTAVDANWQTITTIVSAINVSSLEIANSHPNDDNNGSSLVSCSVSIIRSTFKLAEPLSQSVNVVPSPPFSIPSGRTSNLIGTENLPRLHLFVSTRPQSSPLPNPHISDDTLNEQTLTRTITLQRPLTRADHNGTIQCQVESNNNVDVYLIKTVPINIQYGPELEIGAFPTVNLASEVLQMIAIDCQIDGNPSPSYVWYEMFNQNSSISGSMSYYGQQNPYGQYPSPSGTAGLSVFGTTRQIQRLYQNAGEHVMQCQAQSRGKTVKQQFIITVLPSSNVLKGGTRADGSREKSYRIPMIIGISIGAILLLLLFAIGIAAIIFFKRRKTQPNENRLASSEKLPNDKQGKARRGPTNNLPSDYSKYKHAPLRGDSSSTSYLVESSESSNSQPPIIPNRPSPMVSRNSSYRQPSGGVALSYIQASSLSGVRPAPTISRSYSPDPDDIDATSSNVHPIPLSVNRSRTTTPFGSRKSLSESIQSLRSNQQHTISLPMKKRGEDPPPLPAPILPKREQRTPSPKSFDPKKDYQHHHYHNPAQLRRQYRTANREISSDEEDQELAKQRINQIPEDSAGGGPVPPLSSYIPVDHSQQQLGRRARTPPPPQKIVVHHPSGIHHDEVPPSYQQVANPSSSYEYQEPTEV